MAAIDLIDYSNALVTDAEFAEWMLKVATNYGVATKDIVSRWVLLTDLVKKKRWSGVRFTLAMENLLATKPFMAWTVADVMGFNIDSRLKPYHNRNLPVGPAEIYRVCGQLFWREPSVDPLPFERVYPGQPTGHAAKSGG